MNDYSTHPYRWDPSLSSELMIALTETEDADFFSKLANDSLPPVSSSSAAAASSSSTVILPAQGGLERISMSDLKERITRLIVPSNLFIAKDFQHVYYALSSIGNEMAWILKENERQIRIKRVKSLLEEVTDQSMLETPVRSSVTYLGQKFNKSSLGKSFNKSIKDVEVLGSVFWFTKEVASQVLDRMDNILKLANPVETAVSMWTVEGKRSKIDKLVRPINRSVGVLESKFRKLLHHINPISQLIIHEKKMVQSPLNLKPEDLSVLKALKAPLDFAETLTSIPIGVEKGRKAFGSLHGGMSILPDLHILLKKHLPVRRLYSQSLTGLAYQSLFQNINGLVQTFAAGKELYNLRGWGQEFLSLIKNKEATKDFILTTIVKIRKKGIEDVTALINKLTSDAPWPTGSYQKRALLYLLIKQGLINPKFHNFQHNQLKTLFLSLAEGAGEYATSTTVAVITSLFTLALSVENVNSALYHVPFICNTVSSGDPEVCWNQGLTECVALPVIHTLAKFAIPQVAGNLAGKVAGFGTRAVCQDFMQQPDVRDLIHQGLTDSNIALDQTLQLKLFNEDELATLRADMANELIIQKTSAMLKMTLKEGRALFGDEGEGLSLDTVLNIAIIPAKINGILNADVIAADDATIFPLEDSVEEEPLSHRQNCCLKAVKLVASSPKVIGAGLIALSAFGLYKGWNLAVKLAWSPYTYAVWLHENT